MKHKISLKIINIIKEEHRKLKKYYQGRKKYAKNGKKYSMQPIHFNDDDDFSNTLNDTQSDTSFTYTAEEFAKAVGINIHLFHDDDIHEEGEEENHCSCPYCTDSYSKSYDTSHNFISRTRNSVINSKTIDIPGYGCCHRGKKSTSKIVDMSLFINPFEQEHKNGKEAALHPRQRSATIPTAPTYQPTIDLDDGCQRSASISMGNHHFTYSSSPDTFIDTQIQSIHPICRRCDSAIHLYNSTIGSSTTTTTTTTNPMNIMDSKKSNPSYDITHSSYHSIPTIFYPSRNTSIPLNANHTIPSMKHHSKYKITKSVVFNEGVRCEEIDIKPKEKEEIKVMKKGRFTITHESSKRISC